jgi:uncharacterized protein with HEPN domain
MRPEAGDAAYLREMRQAAATICRISHGASLADYESNEMRRFAVERGLEIIGEAAGRVSPDFRTEHTAIPWRAIVGQRNILAHDYGAILNWRI